MRRHRGEPAALVTGLVFLSLAAVLLVDAAGGWDAPLRWTVVLTAVGLALSVLTAACTGVVRARRRPAC